MSIVSKNLSCEISLAVTMGGIDIAPPNSHIKSAPAEVCQTHRFCGSIKGLSSYFSDTRADPKRVLSLLSSRGVVILGARFLDPPRSHLGVAYFRPSDVAEWRINYPFPYSHLSIGVSRDEWESLDLYEDGAMK